MYNPTQQIIATGCNASQDSVSKENCWTDFEMLTEGTYMGLTQFSLAIEYSPAQRTIPK